MIVITFHKNKSFTIFNYDSNGDSSLDMNESEALSFAFIEKLVQYSPRQYPSFSIEIPLKNIDFYFHYTSEKTIKIGYKSRIDSTDTQELCLDAKDFYMSLIGSLMNYFINLTMEQPLQNYVIDNDSEQNEQQKWRMDFISMLKLNASFITN